MNNCLGDGPTEEERTAGRNGILADVTGKEGKVVKLISMQLLVITYTTFCNCYREPYLAGRIQSRLSVARLRLWRKHHRRFTRCPFAFYPMLNILSVILIRYNRSCFHFSVKGAYGSSKQQHSYKIMPSPYMVHYKSRS